MGSRSRFALSTTLLTVASILRSGGVVVFRMAVPSPVPWLRRPAVALVVAAGLWGAAVSGTKYALDGFDPVTLLSVELLAGAGVLWVALFVRGYRPTKSWWLPAVLGLLEPALAADAAVTASAMLRFPALAGSYRGDPVETFRRRSCCLIYRVASPPATEYCGDCILGDRPTRLA